MDFLDTLSHYAYFICSLTMAVFQVLTGAVTMALKRLMGLTGTVNELRGQCALFFLLIALCLARTQLTITAAELCVIPYSILPEVVQKYIHVKLNDVVIVAIYLLVPVLCGRSIAGLYGSLQLTSLRGVFYNAFFTDEVNLLKLIPTIIFLLTSASAVYMFRLVYFIYKEWTTAFSPLVQTLQFYPAILIIFQTLHQGIFLLQAFGNRSFLHTVAEPSYKMCLKQLEHHVLLNFTLLVHCCSIVAIVRYKYANYDEHDLIIDLAVGEILYRLFAVWAFSRLRTKVQIQGNKSTENGIKESAITSKDQDAQSSLMSLVMQSTPWDQSKSEMV